VKRVTEAEAEMFRLGRRSIVASRDVAEGAALTREDLAIKRPGFGIPVHDIDQVVGRHTARALEQDEVLRWDDLVR
jgi:sialic acid synthase SpsE